MAYGRGLIKGYKLLFANKKGLNALCTGKWRRVRNRNRQISLSFPRKPKKESGKLISEKRLKKAVIFLLVLFALSIAVNHASAVTTLLTEVASSSSTGDSTNPAMAMNPNDPTLMHMVWEDDSDFAGSTITREINNGPEKDIVYTNKDDTVWLSKGIGTSSIYIVSDNTSMTSSQNPDITTGYNNITHVVWQGITKPEALTADSNTLFLAHFDGPSFDADYSAAELPSALSSTGVEFSDNNSIYNKSVYLEGTDYLSYDAGNNINMTKGTIEIWYNPQHRSRNYELYILFSAWNSSNNHFYIGLDEVEDPSGESTNPYFYIFMEYNSSNIRMSYYPPYELKKNEWHHIAFAYDFSDPSAGICRFYLDGYLALMNNSCDSFSFNPESIAVGSIATAPSYSARGQIDELRLSNSIRTDAEIRADAGQRDLFYNSMNGTTWAGVSIITSDDDNNSYFPRMDVDKNDTLHLVWESFHNDTFSIVKYREKKHGSAWSSSEVVSGSETATHFPDIAVDHLNYSHIVWQDVDLSSGNFSYFSTIRYSKKNLTSWAPIENISNRTSDAFGVSPTTFKLSYFFSTPRVAVSADNITHVAWSTQAGFPDKDLLFYLSFDDLDGNVTYANGSKLSGQNESYFHVAGRSDTSNAIYTGYAARVNATGYINYSSQNNINPNYGTIMMWVYPLWDPGVQEPMHVNSIFAYYSSNASLTDKSEYITSYIKQCDDTITLICLGDATTSLLYFHIYDNKTENNVMYYNISSWESSAWHHVAFTWNLTAGNNATKMYIDGDNVPAAHFPDNNSAMYFNDTPTEIVIGNLFNESTADYPYAFNGSIDEVMIFDRILDESEIDSCRKRDLDIAYRQRNESGWQNYELASELSTEMSILPSIAPKDGNVYLAWVGADSSYEYYTNNYYHGAFFKAAMNIRNTTSWKGVEVINDESPKEAYAPEIKASSPGKIDILWEDTIRMGGTNLHILYREFSNSTTPKVQLTSPTGGEVITSNLDVEATSEDPDSTISNVSFYYTTDDGLSGNLICTATSSPYSCTWTIGLTSEDFYKVKAITTSNDGGRNWSMSNYMYVDSSASVNMYNFNLTGNDAGSNVIYNKSWTKDTEQFNIPDPTNESTFGNDITDLAKANVSVSDGDYYVVSNNLGCGIYNLTNSIMFKFYIDETPSDILNMRIQWQGYGYVKNGYYTNLSIWNFDTSSWESLANKNFVYSERSDLSSSLTSGFSSYLDPTDNFMYILVTTDEYYSEVCGMTMYLPFGGCPAYLSWNGTDYQFETEGILAIFDRRSEFPTYDKLNNIKPVNGTIRLAIAEVVDETTYMDSAELITVDHGTDADVLLDLNGIPHTIMDPEKVICTDMMGNDCTALVEAQDEKPKGASSSMKNGLVGSRSMDDMPLMNGPEGNYWVSDLSALNIGEKGTRDYIGIELPKQDEDHAAADADGNDKIKIIISGSDTGLLWESESGLFSLAGDTLPYLYSLMDDTKIGELGADGIFKAVPLKIQFLDDGGRWVDYPGDFRNAVFGSYRTLVFPLDRSIIRSSRIRINMMAYSYMIDYVGVDYSADEDVAVNRIRSEDPLLRESDDSRKILHTGDFYEISFREPEKGGSRKTKRSYFLMTEGYYHPLERGIEITENNMKEKEGIEDEANDENMPDNSMPKIGNMLDAISAISKVKNGTTYARMIYDPAYAEEHMLDMYLDKKLNEARSSSGQQADGRKHNSLYTDFVRVIIGKCIVPVDGLKIYENTQLCANSAFTVADSDGDGKIIEILGQNLVFDCRRSSIDSGGDDNPQRNQGAGIAIGLNHTQNVTVKNCNLSRYSVGIGWNYSKDLLIFNNTVEKSYMGIACDRSNNSVIRDNYINYPFYVGFGLAGDSRNNTVVNNTVVNSSLLAYALEGADENLIAYNLANGSSDKACGTVCTNVGALGLTKSANMNTIRNNTINNFYMGIGMVDVGSFFGQSSYGESGQGNNFSSNIITNVLVEGIGLLYPYDADYHNYFDQNNLIKGEKFYYYYDVHGNETNYVQVSDLNLTAGNTSMFTGKITIVNCSYINITNNNVSGNYYGIQVFESHHILLSNNRAFNNREPLFASLLGVPRFVMGAGYAIMRSHDINLTDNNASENYFGYYTKNSYNLTFINNSASMSLGTGFYINSTNISSFINNTADQSGLSAYLFINSWLNRIVNNTARDGAATSFETSITERQKGFYFENTFNNTITDNLAYNCTYGFFMNITNETFANNTAINNSLAGVVFINCLSGTVINETGNIVENNTGAGYIFAGCNNALVTNLNTTQNNRTGFEIYSSHDLTLSNLWSKLNDKGFIFNASYNCTLTNSYSINSTSHEIYFYSSTDNNIADSTIINNVSGNDVYSTTNSWNYMVNTSFNQSNIADSGNSNLSVQWHLDFYVQDNESIPVEGASIWMNDTLAQEYDAATGTNARARLNLTEYVTTGGVKSYYSNYTWNATKAGYMSNVSMVNMTENKEINVTINLFGGITDISPPTSPIVYDGYDYVDYDWTNNASTLFGSWSNSTDRHLIFYGYRIFENGTCLPGKCAPTEVEQATQVQIDGLTLREGYNYTLSVRARDSSYYYSPFIFSDGAIVDLTQPNVTVNSTTHMNSSQWYSSPNATFTFYGNDSLSGISGYSFMLDGNSGTGPDFVEDTRADLLLQSAKNNGQSKVLRANSTGSAFAAITKINSNLTTGDNLTIRVALREDVSDTSDPMTIEAYLIPKDTSITTYELNPYKISNIDTKVLDLSSKALTESDYYSFNLVATSASSDSFYIVIASNLHDDNNTHNISILGTSTDLDNSTSSLICEEGTSCTNITTSFDYAIEVKKKDNSTVWSKTYSNLANGEHWFHVRSRDVAGSWSEPGHFKVMIDSVNGTPLYTTVTPVGYIATTEPTLVVETNEYTACLYNTTNTTYTEMTSYDGLHHESKLTGLSSATYTYSFNCTDRAGNSGYNDTTFIVDMNAAPDTVSIYSMGNYTAGKTMSIDVNATKTYSGIVYGLGELAGYFTINVTNSTDTYRISSTVKDMGNGKYIITFTAPPKAGAYTLTVAVRGVSDTQTFNIASYSVTIKYSSSDLANANIKTRMAYSIVGSSYIIGVAGDAPTATTSGSTSSNLQIAGPAINNNLYLFITRSTGEPGSVSRYIDGGIFLDLQNAAFGYPTSQEEHVLSAMLEYKDISIIGSNKVQEGRYTLIIKNEGVNQTTGKTKVSVTII